MQKKKIQYIEYLRVLSAVAVVGIHITMTQPNNFSVTEIGEKNYLCLTSAYALLQWAVPVFLMITGSLLLHYEALSLKKVKKMTIRMAEILLIFGSGFALLEQIFNEKTVSLIMIPKALLFTLERNSWSHLWYLYILIGFYLIAIPLKRFVDGATCTEYIWLVGILMVGNFVIPTINMALGVKITTFMVFSEYITYILLGYALRDMKQKTEGNECIGGGIDRLLTDNGLWLCTLIFSSVTKIIIQCVTVIKTGAGSVLFLNDRFFTLLQAVSVYCLVKNHISKAVKTEVAPLIESISKCSFGIYLIHPFYINFLYKVLNVTPTSFSFGSVFVGIFILWIGVFMISWLTSWIMLRMPILRKLL